MALEHIDFILTDEQLELINRYFSTSNAAYAESGEDAPNVVSVTFEWTPGIGRSVCAYFDNGSIAYEIEPLFR